MNDQDKGPDWLREGDGFADITLARAATIAGTKMTVMRMREPTVGDQLTAAAVKGGDVDQELAMFANLLEVAPDDIKGMSMRNYRRLQVAYSGFMV